MSLERKYELCSRLVELSIQTLRIWERANDKRKESILSKKDLKQIEEIRKEIQKVKAETE